LKKSAKLCAGHLRRHRKPAQYRTKQTFGFRGDPLPTPEFSFTGINDESGRIPQEVAGRNEKVSRSCRFMMEFGLSDAITKFFDRARHRVSGRV
jgi:hypothetical protein